MVLDETSVLLSLCVVFKARSVLSENSVRLFRALEVTDIECFIACMLSHSILYIYTTDICHVCSMGFDSEAHRGADRATAMVFARRRRLYKPSLTS